jgi:hypothetical protein
MEKEEKREKVKLRPYYYDGCGQGFYLARCERNAITGYYRQGNSCLFDCAPTHYLSLSAANGHASKDGFSLSFEGGITTFIEGVYRRPVIRIRRIKDLESVSWEAYYNESVERAVRGASVDEAIGKLVRDFSWAVEILYPDTWPPIED